MTDLHTLPTKGASEILVLSEGDFPAPLLQLRSNRNNKRRWERRRGGVKQQWERETSTCISYTAGPPTKRTVLESIEP